MRLVELADEYGLTTADAIDLCAVAGVEAESSATDLTDAEATRWRVLADEQLATRIEADDGIEIVDDRGDFGPLPPAPWEQSPQELNADRPPKPPPAAPSAIEPPWGADVGIDGSYPQVSLHATIALALAVVSLIFPFAIPAVVAIPLSWLAKRQIAASDGNLTGDRLANAALVLSALGIALWTVIVVANRFGYGSI